MPDLLPFQEVGRDFLLANRRGILGDEQRVGKTPQAIAATEAMNARSVLVLCPAIARMNWIREFMRWGGRPGTAIVEKHDEPERMLTVCSYSQLVVPTVYEKLRKPWHVVIFDEAHFLKTEEAQRSAAAMALGKAAWCCWALSGTIMPNHAGELYPLLYNFGAVKCSYNDFLYRYCDVNDEGKVIGNKPEMVETLRALLKPLMLRRTLAEVAPEMPPIRWETIAVSPGRVESQLIFAAADDMGEPMTSTIAGRMRASTQAKRLEARLEEAKGEIEQLDPRDSLWFRRFCALQKIEPIVEMLEAEFEAGLQRIVIFGWHTDSLRAIALRLNLPVIYGETPHTERQRIIDEFKAGKHRGVCAQIVTAGTAIDLSMSDEALFVEQSWVPSDNSQAVMRVVSQFKTRPTRARVVSIAGSVDEAVQRSLQRKTRMVNQILN